VQAVRVPNVPAAEFESAIEGDDPATVTALAAMGTKVREVRKIAGKIWEQKKLRGWGEARNDIEPAASRSWVPLGVGPVTKSAPDQVGQRLRALAYIEARRITKPVPASADPASGGGQLSGLT
jgi:hypothetical protein